MGVIGGTPGGFGSARKQTADWLKKGIRPDVAVTFTLSKAISTDTGRERYWTRGDRIRYSAAWDQFIKRLSCRCLKKAYKRFKKLIPNGASIEGDGEIKRFHLHGFLRKPEHMTFEEFTAAIEWTWRLSPWSRTDVKIEPITGEWVGYSVKDGPEAMLTGSLSF